MNEKEIDNLYDRAIKLWGKELQVDLMIEECSELIKALSKNRRKPKSNKVLNNVHEEIADVEIVLDQMKKIFDLDDEKFNIIKEKKLVRLKKKLDSRCN